jgi:superfamily I DNA/RNA helicase
MRALQPVRATPEQLALLGVQDPAVVIYGAAGSGKTTTALIRLRALAASWLSRRSRLGLEAPVRILVLTYNKTLAGYIDSLAKEQIQGSEHLNLFVGTFAKWAVRVSDSHGIADGEDNIRTLVSGLSNDRDYCDFLTEEAIYVMERFLPEAVDEYLTVRRDGRGSTPRIDKAMRQRLLDEVVKPYQASNRAVGSLDWNDLAVAAYHATSREKWDIVVIDEAQDFTANQLRAVVAHLSETHSLTCVLDSMQRIYHRYFTWKEVGIDAVNSTHRLAVNHRNTKQIAAFARPLVAGLTRDNELGSLPDFQNCTREGPLPTLVRGLYSKQMAYVFDHYLPAIDLQTESVAFLHPKGGGYFRDLREALEARGYPWDELTRTSDWPSNDNALALSTMHSAKGLEFDHVIALGLNQDLTPHGDEEDDAHLGALQRLVAMSVGRAKKSVVLGTKPGAESSVFEFLDPETYVAVTV